MHVVILGPWMLWGTDEVGADAIMVGLWVAAGQAENYQDLLHACFIIGTLR